MKRRICKQYQVPYKIGMAYRQNESRRLMKTNCKYPYLLKGKRKKTTLKPVSLLCTRKVQNVHVVNDSKFDDYFLMEEMSAVGSNVEPPGTLSLVSEMNQKSMVSKTMKTITKYPPEVVVSLVFLCILAAYIFFLNIYKVYATPIFSKLTSNYSRRLPDCSLPDFEFLMQQNFFEE